MAYRRRDQGYQPIEYFSFTLSIMKTDLSTYLTIPIVILCVNSYDGLVR